MTTKKTKEAQVLVIVPAPNSADTAIGGSVARWVSEGKDVVYVVCSKGNKGLKGARGMSSADELEKMRKKEQLAVAKVLGVRESIYLGYESHFLEDTVEFRKDITRLIRKYKPETVVTCDPYPRYNLHRDSRVTGQVVLDCVFPYARDPFSFPELLKEEGLERHMVTEVLLWGTDQPNYYSDVTDTFAKKMEAAECRVSELHAPNPQSREWGTRVERERQQHMRAAEGQDFNLAEVFHKV